MTNDGLELIINKKKFVTFYSLSIRKNNKKLFQKISNKSLLTIAVNTFNPEYLYINKQFKKIKDKRFDFILAIGGGKTIDTAKLIKYLFFVNNRKKKLIVLPTLFGSGTEITDSAISYFDSRKYAKQSIEVQPTKIIYNFAIALQAPRKKIIYSALDCFCQSLESIWSIRCNTKSLKYAKQSLSISYSFLNSDLNNIEINQLQKMSEASIKVGKAMNITRTTAPHALSYPLTAYLKIPHGLAVSLIMKFCIFENLNTIKEVNKINIIKKIFKTNDMFKIYSQYLKLLKVLKIEKKINLKKNQINKFIKEINLERLNNNPIKLNKKNIIKIYSKI